MKDTPKTRKDNMGKLNNNIVKLIDESGLTSPDVAIVLRMLANRIELLFELSLTTENK